MEPHERTQTMKARMKTIKPAQASLGQVKNKYVVPPEERRKNGQFKPGVSGNPAGQGKQTSRQTELRLAIEAAEKSMDGRKWLEHQVLKSYEDTSLAIAIMSRLYPSLKAVEMLGMLGVGRMSDEESCEIQNILRQRYAKS